MREKARLYALAQRTKARIELLATCPVGGTVCVRHSFVTTRSEPSDDRRCFGVSIHRVNGRAHHVHRVGREQPFETLQAVGGAPGNEREAGAGTNGHRLVLLSLRHNAAVREGACDPPQRTEQRESMRAPLSPRTCWAAVQCVQGAVLPFVEVSTSVTAPLSASSESVQWDPLT